MKKFSNWISENKLVSLLILVGIVWAVWYFFIKDKGQNTRMYRGGGRTGGGAMVILGGPGYPYPYNPDVELYDKDGNAINPKPNQRVSCNPDCLMPYSSGSQYHGYYYCSKNCSGGSF